MFNKKKKQSETQEDVQDIIKVESNSRDISKNVYKVYLKEKVGNTLATFATFETNRWFEDDSEIPYLKNNKLGFLEIMPEANKDYLKIPEKELDKQIKDCEHKLSEIKKIDDPKVIMEKFGNPKNWEYKLMTLKAKKNALKYDDRVYMSFGQNGEKEFSFIREGSNYIPQAIDNETFTAFFPPDSKKKTFSFTHRNKQQKLGMNQKLMSLAQAAGWIFGILFLFVTGYLMFQAQDSYSNSEIVQAKVGIVEAEQRQLENIERLYDVLEKELNKEQTVIEGVRPE